jgi:hypothetical protein
MNGILYFLGVLGVLGALGGSLSFLRRFLRELSAVYEPNALS